MNLRIVEPNVNLLPEKNLPFYLVTNRILQSFLLTSSLNANVDQAEPLEQLKLKQKVKIQQIKQKTIGMKPVVFPIMLTITRNNQLVHQTGQDFLENEQNQLNRSTW